MTLPITAKLQKRISIKPAACGLAIIAASSLFANAATANESLEEQVEMLQPVLSQPAYTHCNERVQGPVFDNRSPYQPTRPPPCSVNRHGKLRPCLALR